MIQSETASRPSREETRLPGQGFARALHASRTARILDRIYRSERDGVHAYLRRAVGTEHACDLTQEVFLRAARCTQLSELRNPGGFLHCIARNLVIDFVRRRSSRHWLISAGDNPEGKVPAGQDERLMAREAETSVAIALAALPPRTARIFIMNRFDNKTYREIHAELGIALGTVDYHMMKALSHLRCALAEHLSTPQFTPAGPYRKNNYS